MSRRKLERSLTRDQQFEMWDNNRLAEKSMDQVYHLLRERYGARHKLTLKAEQSVRRINEFKYKLKQALGEYGDDHYSSTH